ncbi:MAG: glycosyltransferase [Patescibacteria group bacterium]
MFFVYRGSKKFFRSIFPSFYNKIEKYKIIIKYIISGGTAAVVDLSALYFFTSFCGIWYVLSSSLAFLLAYFVSFSLQKFWTFRDNGREKIRQQMYLYFIVGVANLFLNGAGMYLLVDKFGVMYLLAQIIIGAILGASSFIIYRFIIFKKKRIHSKLRGDKKRILIATGIFPPDIGGPATYVKVLLEELPKFGYEVKVVTYTDNQGEGDEKDPQIFRIGRQQNIFFRYFKYFWKVFELSEWADIIYVQGPISEGLPTCLACCLRKRKYILKVVGDYAWEQGRQRFGVNDLLDTFQNNKYSRRVEFIRKMQKIVASSASRVITPSEYLKTIIMKWGVEAEKIKVIYNSIGAIKEIDLKINKEAARESLNLKGSIILSVGRLVPWKGFDLLIDLMPELLQENSDFKLIIAGAGPDKEKIEEKIKNLKLEKNVILTGGIDQHELFKYMLAADIFLLNTGYEGLPHVVIEAMRLSLPVITTDVGGNREVVENNKTGLLVEYNNREQIKEAILNLNKDKNLISTLTANAEKQIVEKFSQEQMINNIVKELGEALKN